MYIVKIIRNETKVKNVFSATSFSAEAREICITQYADKIRVPLGSFDKVFITEDGKTIESWTASEDPDAAGEKKD